MLMSTPAIAAVKAGATCSAKGQVKISSGYKYTCIKSGKKLVWSKGVKVAVKVTPTPTPTPTLVETPSYKTAKNFFNTWATSTQSKSNNIYAVSTTLNQSQVQFMIDTQEKFYGFWLSQGVTFSSSITTYFFTELDRTWLSQREVPSGCVFDQWLSGSFANQADGRVCQSTDGRSFVLFPIGSEFIKQDSRFKTFGLEAAAHEIEHVVQNELFRYRMPDPCWFREGFTTYSVWIQTSYEPTYKAMTSLKSATYRNLMSNLKKSNLIINGKKSEEWTNKEWLEILDYQPSNPVCWGRNADGTPSLTPIYLGYSAGPFIVEKMYIDFGVIPTVNFMKSVGLLNNFSLAFSQVFGVEYSKWMISDAIPWLLSGGETSP